MVGWGVWLGGCGGVGDEQRHATTPTTTWHFIPPIPLPTTHPPAPQQILKYHILPAPVVAANLDDGKKYATLLSAELPQVGVVGMGVGWGSGWMGAGCWGIVCCRLLPARARPCFMPPAAYCPSNHHC